LEIQNRNGISTAAGVSIVVILLVIAAGAYYYIAYVSPSSSSTTPPTTTAGPLPGKGMAIGVVFDVGGLGDRGFNDLAYQGMKEANTTLGTNFYYEVLSSTSDTVPDMEALIAKHVNLLVGVGYDFDSAMVNESAKYPNQNFAQVDGDIYNVTNVVAIKFQEHVGSAIVAALSVAMTKTDKIAFLGGVATGIIYKFWNGWKFGAEWASNYLHKNVTLLKTYDSTDFSVGFSDLKGGQANTQSFISQGADIVYMVAGGTGIGGFNAIGAYDQQQGWGWSTTAPPVWAIGVDANQDYYGTYQSYVQHSTNASTYQAPSFVLTSEIKKVDVGVFNVMKSVVYGNYSNFWNDPATFGQSFWTGQTTLCGATGDQACHVHNVYLLGLKQGAVGPTSFQYTSGFLTPAAKNVMTQITNGILNGSIKIPEIYTDTPV
jgi:basic membrane protein A and related proteins